MGGRGTGRLGKWPARQAVPFGAPWICSSICISIGIRWACLPSRRARVRAHEVACPRGLRLARHGHAEKLAHHAIAVQLRGELRKPRAQRGSVHPQQALQLLLRLWPQRRSWSADTRMVPRARFGTPSSTTVARPCCILHTGANRARVSALHTSASRCCAGGRNGVSVPDAFAPIKNDRQLAVHPTSGVE